MKQKAGIFCGHGKSQDGSWDCGTVYKDENEAALMLPMTKAFAKYMRSAGITVVTDADSDNNMNMIAQVAKANREKTEVFISLHCDYYKAPSGTMPLYVSKEGKKLAKCLNDAVMERMGMKTRGLTKRTDLYELTATDMPACIFETGSIKADLKRLKDAKDYGFALAMGLCQYLGVDMVFEVKTRGKLIVRKTSLLASPKLRYLERDKTYRIIKTNKKGTRGKLAQGGWITITDKYVKIL